MEETVEAEWLEGNRYNNGKPTGFRRFKTEFDGNMTIEKVILAIAEPMEQRNQEKTDGNDNGIFYKEALEDVFLDAKDGYWRYVVSMGYIQAGSDIRKKCQEKQLK